MDVQVASELCFKYFTYAQKDNEIIFSMQIDIISKFIRNQQESLNNVLIVATDMMMSSHPLL
jgi:16S rRNA A1518/A1519 N6-dimethyltransferase RsmA/KsgA/DIM1 with predicted DNA glycosylase/AP lyase activity